MEENKRQWTDSQLAAISTRDRTLLVSAAAGSGKTATLTERIIASILDENNPINIEEMLIVTFTRAAVGELKQRIGDAIRAEVKKRPGDERLERQLRMLPIAKICTIDAFCAEILRANADKIGVSPTFRVPDEAEAMLLGETILDALLDALFEGKAEDVATPSQIDALTDCLAQTRKQSELPAIIQSIYSSTLSSLEGVESIGALVEEFNPSRFSAVEHTSLGAYCLSRLKEAKEHYTRIFSSALAEIEAQNNPKCEKIEKQTRDALKLLSSLGECDSYKEAREALLGFELEKSLPSPRGLDLPPITHLRKALKQDMATMRDELFCTSCEDWLTAYTGLYEQFGTLYRIIKEFDRLFRGEKQRRGMCEFSDIERYTYECLWENGERTEVARAQAGIYKAIYIDEYQDVNSLQNKIFEAISTDTNRFMVGDIKQSIYEFRSANPTIFANMKKSYTPLGQDGDFPYSSIFMSENFRCDEGVIDFVNHIFDSVFYNLRDSIGYVTADRLNFSKKYKHESPPYRYPEITLVPAPPKKKAGDDAEENEDGADNADVPMTVAKKIRRLIDEEYLDDGTKIEPKHIAIIMRKVKNKADAYKDALASLGIPSAVAESNVFFINSDVLLVLCLLNAIDNPRKDVYLAGLLCSPIYNFGIGDIALIRKKAPAATLLDSLRLYRESEEEGGRVGKFLDKLSYYRLICEGMPTDKLLMRLYHETGLLALASSKAQSRDNLMLLYEHARKFESGSFKGLYNFISYINQLTGRKNEFDKREAPGECDAVRIITAHGSKGLEYPIVFFVGADASFKRSGLSPGEEARFEYEEGFGMGMYLRSPSGLAVVKNPTKNIVKHYRYRKKIEEEARILYVILTRARERLYVVSKARRKTDDYLKEITAEREYMSSYSVYKLSSFLDMIMTAHDFTPFLEIAETSEGEDKAAKDEKVSPITDTPDRLDEGVAELIADELRKRFAFLYPNAHMSAMPGKLSVSKLYPEILDGSDVGVAKIDSDTPTEDEDTDDSADKTAEKEKRQRLPRFRSNESANDSAERGIATHMLLQFCDFDALYKNGAQTELERLRIGGFLSNKDAERVRINEIERFRGSRLIKDILAAKRVFKEFRFNVKLPAERFTSDEELKRLYKGEGVLVQGVIDCLYEDSEGRLHLVDYKTDRLTREELKSPELARRKMYEKHSLQLSYYAAAVELMFGKYPSTVEVYSLPLGKLLDVSTPEK